MEQVSKQDINKLQKDVSKWCATKATQGLRRGGQIVGRMRGEPSVVQSGGGYSKEGSEGEKSRQKEEIIGQQQTSSVDLRFIAKKDGRNSKNNRAHRY